MKNHKRFNLVDDVLKITTPSTYIDLILSFDYVVKTNAGYSIDIHVEEVE